MSTSIQYCGIGRPKRSFSLSINKGELGCIDIVHSSCGAEGSLANISTQGELYSLCSSFAARLMGTVRCWGLLPLVLVFYKTPCQQKTIMTKQRFVQQSVHNSINLKILPEKEIDLSDQE
ncbi:hypothetical protein POTOM_042624 [Populus tomentosa]|uniref:Uncharacterized protein n=1 Tax=Populus tomentosa TaxID=118781 RepID=A0A8X7YX15_POPTO|nr:hypothetical protein POTOM_042624 [Populus tomentosa]